MKTLIKNFALILGLIAFTLPVSATVDGSGAVTRHTFLVNNAVKSLVVEGEFDVYLNFGSEASVTVETDENLQGQILIDDDGHTLFIRMKEHTGKSSKMNLYVTINQLEQMGFKDVVTVKSSNFLWFNQLNLTLNTIGKTDLQLAANALNVQIEGAGDLHLAGNVRELNIRNTGLGNVITKDLATEKLTIHQEKNRNVELRLGKKELMEVKVQPASAAESTSPKA